MTTAGATIPNELWHLCALCIGVGALAGVCLSLIVSLGIALHFHRR